MLQVNSLTDKRIFENKIDLLVSDLDYTLINFGLGHQAGVKNISKVLGQNVANEFNDIFNLIHEKHIVIDKENWDKQSRFSKIISQMKSLKFVKNQYGLKEYSREFYFIIALKKFNLEPKKQTIEAARDAYWSGIKDSSPIYNDTKTFLSKLGKTPIIIMTGSDSVMTIADDLSLEYVPELSKAYKESRVKKVPFQYQGLIIGDPWDKPDERFFNLVEMEIKRLGGFNKQNILFLGDSYHADLEVPERRGYKTVLIKR